MRKIIFIAFWAMLMIMPAVGQVTFGVRAGGAYSSLVQKVEGTYNAGARFGFSLAGLADIHLYKGLSLRPELAFVNQGGSFYSNPQVEGAKNSFNKCSYYSIQVPVNLAYTFIINDVQLGVYAGPTLDFSLFGKMKTENTSISISARPRRLISKHLIWVSMSACVWITVATSFPSAPFAAHWIVAL